MKKSLLIILSILTCSIGFFGCKKTEPFQWKPSETIVSPYARESDEIEISLPVAGGDKSEYINREINRAVAGFLGDPEKTVREIVDIRLEDRNQDAVIAHIPYIMTVSGETSEYGKYASVALNLYQFMGGAHGIGFVNCLIFDTETGELVSYSDLFDETEALIELNRYFFEQKVPEHQKEWSVPTEALPLPENALLDSSGLHVYYNSYEIAPYSAGPIEYLIPSEEIAGLLRAAVKNGGLIQ